MMRYLALVSILVITACKPGMDTPNSLLIEQDRQPDEIVKIWPEGPPGKTPEGLVEKFVHRENKFNLVDRAVHEVTDPSLSIFRPKKPNGTAILLIPGGGYRWVVVDKEGFEGARLFNQFGATVYVMSYRLPHQGWTAGPDTPLQDAQRAIRVIRARASQDGLDPSKILVMGFSAGGHLAGSLTNRFDAKIYPPIDEMDTLSARPDASVLIYPVITLAQPFTHGSTSKNMLGKSPTVDQLKTYSVDQSVPVNAPPVFILHASDDMSVPIENALMAYDGYRKAGIDSTMHIFGSGGHGFGLRGIDDDPLRDWPRLVRSWAQSKGFLVP